MHCLRHILLYAILIPMPAASPAFLLVFTVAAYWAIRPCGYCMTILALLFFSTSPSSPFLAVLSDTPAPPPAPSPAVAYDMNIPERGAFFLNGGYIFDPVLVGYREMQHVWRETLEGEKQDMSGSAVTATEASATTPLESSDSAGEGEPTPPAPSSAAVPAHTVSPGLPDGYVDLRIGGVGLVLDLGWYRTDEGLRWEAANVRDAAEAKRSRRSLRGLRHPAPPQPIPAPTPAAAWPEKGGNEWLRSPFVGLW